MERGGFGFEVGDALGGGRGEDFGCGVSIGVGLGDGFDGAAEKMGVAGFSGSGLPGQDGGEGAVGAGIGVRWNGTGGEAVEGGDDGGEVVEGEHAVGSAAKLAGGLRAAEEEEAEDCGLVAAKIEDGADAMLVLGDTRISIGCGEAAVLKGVKSLADGFFVEVEDGIAAGALVAGVDKRVE